MSSHEVTSVVPCISRTSQKVQPMHTRTRTLLAIWISCASDLPAALSLTVVFSLIDSSSCALARSSGGSRFKMEPKTARARETGCTSCSKLAASLLTSRTLNDLGGKGGGGGEGGGNDGGAGGGCGDDGGGGDGGGGDGGGGDGVGAAGVGNGVGDGVGDGVAT
jgi:hypothetical protein